ncbi:ABC transporter permease [Pseudoflavitalea rhizosphaerae]|uniref:ABC transporter permease n=1 Tax=Pseudoflavitalea rhizosphaerae TaxID=1884793 RepID=UPI000F8E0F3E|nr:ABC transporter permease [Pseudoflavitalea rhizosphaerae]
MSGLKRCWTIAARELRTIATDHSLLLTLLLAPLLYAFFYGSIYIDKEEVNVPLAVVDDDQSSLSRLLTEQFNNTQAIRIVGAKDVRQAQEMLNREEVQGYIYLQKGLEEKVMALQQANIVLAVSVSRFLPPSDLLGAVTQVSMTVSAGVRLKYFQKKGMTEAIAMQETNPVALDYRPLFNERTSYGAYLLPGLLMLILQQTLLIGLAASMARERQERTFGELYQLAGNRFTIAFTGKGAFYFVLYGIYALFFLTVNFTILKLPIRGDYFSLVLLIGLFIATLIPMALWLGSLFKTTLLAVQLMGFSTYPFFLITGYAWPYEELPFFLKALSSLLPTTPFLQAYTTIVQQGGDLWQAIPQVTHLAALWLTYAILLAINIRRKYKV